MKFKFKAIAAIALAGLLSSGTASAISKSADGEMFLVVFDQTSTASYIKSLNVSATAFTGLTNMTAINLSGDQNFTDFKNTTNYSAATTYYSVLGFKSGTDVTSAALKTTANPIVATSLTNTKMNEVWESVSTGSLGTWMATNNSTVTNGTSKYVAPSLFDDSAAVIGNDWGRILQTLSTSGVGTSALIDNTNGFYSFTTTPNENSRAWGNTALTNLGGSNAGEYVSLGNFNLTSAGAFTYAAVAAVPESDTSAMLLAGIGLMGFIARRRNVK